MKIMLIGVGASGNKAVINSISRGVVKEQDTILINSTSKDIPKDYTGNTIIISPDDYGCGKEIKVARKYAMNAIKTGKFDGCDNALEYDSIIFITSTEGGTGSGATPILAQYFAQKYGRNVHVIAFTGFEEDVRGLSNTIQFFKNMNDNLIIQTISNASFMNQAGGNKFKAEQMANDELAQRIRIITGMDFIESDQNIDNMDILKVSNTVGYMTAEKSIIRKPLIDQNDFNSLMKHMIMDSHSLKSNNPGTARLALILNVNESEDAIDYKYTGLIEAFGKPYEIFLQKQWDGKDEYIAMIISGMDMPIDEVEAMYNRYKEETEKVNKKSDSFFDKMQSFDLDDNDAHFDMIVDASDNREQVAGFSVDDFLNNL